MDGEAGGARPPEPERHGRSWATLRGRPLRDRVHDARRRAIARHLAHAGTLGYEKVREPFLLMRSRTSEAHGRSKRGNWSPAGPAVPVVPAKAGIRFDFLGDRPGPDPHRDARGPASWSRCSGPCSSRARGSSSASTRRCSVVHREASLEEIRQHWFVSTLQAMVPSELEVAALRRRCDSSFEGVTLQGAGGAVRPAGPGPLVHRRRWRIERRALRARKTPRPGRCCATDEGALAFQYADVRPAVARALAGGRRRPGAYSPAWSGSSRPADVTLWIVAPRPLPRARPQLSGGVLSPPRAKAREASSSWRRCGRWRRWRRSPPTSTASWPLDLRHAFEAKQALEAELGRRSTEATLVYLLATGRMNHRALIVEEEQRFSDSHCRKGVYLPDHGDGELRVTGAVYAGPDGIRFSIQDEGRPRVGQRAPLSPLHGAARARGNQRPPTSRESWPGSRTTSKPTRC